MSIRALKHEVERVVGKEKYLEGYEEMDQQHSC